MVLADACVNNCVMEKRISKQEEKQYQTSRPSVAFMSKRLRQNSLQSQKKIIYEHLQ